VESGATHIEGVMRECDDAKIRPCSKIDPQSPRKDMPLPDIGTTPPAFTLPNQHGERVSLADFAGQNVLVWFYPRAFGNG
jgi:AhpC/TSA family